MARIAGIDIPKNKRGVIALTYIFGVGRSRAKEVLATANVDESIKVQDWSDDQIAKIREQVGSFISSNFSICGYWMLQRNSS